MPRSLNVQSLIFEGFRGYYFQDTAIFRELMSNLGYENINPDGGYNYRYIHQDTTKVTNLNKIEIRALKEEGKLLYFTGFKFNTEALSCLKELVVIKSNVDQAYFPNTKKNYDALVKQGYWGSAKYEHLRERTKEIGFFRVLKGMIIRPKGNPADDAVILDYNEGTQKFIKATNSPDESVTITDAQFGKEITSKFPEETLEKIVEFIRDSNDTNKETTLKLKEYLYG